MNTPPLPCLSRDEAARRAAAGRVNRVRRSDLAEYASIVRRNTLTLFNLLVVPAAVVLLALGDYRAGWSVSAMAIINTVLGLLQEFRAKAQLDRLTLLAEARVRVLRDGSPEEIASGDVVVGDTVLVAAGDPVVADGPVLQSKFLEIDEALLTGESDPQARKDGDNLLSGSFCVAGEGAYRADKVGADAYAQKTAGEARAYSYRASPLQASIDRIVRVLSAVAVVLSLAYVGLSYLRDIPQQDLIRMVAATITSMVPQGLVLMATIALLLGAVNMTAKGAVVNRLSAVEAMADIDTLCMDKTGTLTTNALKLAQLDVAEGRPREAVERLLRVFTSATSDTGNKNVQAIGAALGGEAAEVADRLPFKSQNRYSAVRVKLDGAERVLVLGAAEALTPLTDAVPELPPLTGGLRQLWFAEADADGRAFGGSLDGFRLRMLARVALSDELRPETRAVLSLLADQGIAFKIISGDNPDTVKETVSHLGENAPQPTLRALAEADVLTGRAMEQLSPGDPRLESTVIFGRVAPTQKVDIIRALLARGKSVAMIGDGVNDVLPIKSATLGVAMGEGSSAARTVAGVVLRTNDFGLIPKLLDEGRIIVRNLKRSGKLFLAKNVFMLVLIVGALGLFGLPFPLAPQQVTLLNILTIGAPALLITLDRRKAGRSTEEYSREVLRFVVGTGLVVGCVTLALMLWAAWGLGGDETLQRTFVLSSLVLQGFLTLRRVVGREEGAAGALMTWLPPAFFVAFLAAMYEPTLADFFEVVPLNAGQWATVGAGLLVSLVVFALTDRRGSPPPAASDPTPAASPASSRRGPRR